MRKNSRKQTPPLLDVYVSAIARDDVCSIGSIPRPENIRRLTITTVVKDPDHQLFLAFLSAMEIHSGNTTPAGGQKVAYIKMPGMELSFETGDAAGGDATTAIQLDTWDMDILLAEMVRFGLMDLSGYRQMIDLDTCFWFLRRKVLTYISPKIGTPLEKILPPDLGGLHRHTETYCVGPTLRRSSTGDFDYWKFTAWSPVRSCETSVTDRRRPWAFPVHLFIN